MSPPSAGLTRVLRSVSWPCGSAFAHTGCHSEQRGFVLHPPACNGPPSRSSSAEPDRRHVRREAWQGTLRTPRSFPLLTGTKNPRCPAGTPASKPTFPPALLSHRCVWRRRRSPQPRTDLALSRRCRQKREGNRFRSNSRPQSWQHRLRPVPARRLVHASSSGSSRR